MIKPLNPAVLLVLIISVGLEVAFAHSVVANGLIVIVSLAYLLLQRVKFGKLLAVLVGVLPLALGSAWSFWLFGVGDRLHLAGVYGSRVYAYVMLGAMLSLTVAPTPLLLNVMDHLHLPSTFTYGILAALNVASHVKQQLQQFRFAAKMRGITYHLWQPTLYFKAIMMALQWSDDLAAAMTVNGFTEGARRTRIHVNPIASYEWWVVAASVMIYAGLAFGSSLW